MLLKKLYVDDNGRENNVKKLPSRLWQYIILLNSFDSE